MNLNANTLSRYHYNANALRDGTPKKINLLRVHLALVIILTQAILAANP